MMSKFKVDKTISAFLTIRGIAKHAWEARCSRKKIGISNCKQFADFDEFWKSYSFENLGVIAELLPRKRGKK